MTDDDYDALSQKHLASIKRDMRISLNDAVVRATHKVVTELIEEAVKAERVKEALAQPEERNFCPRCGKRTADLTAIHTCTPPQENT